MTDRDDVSAGPNGAADEDGIDAHLLRPLRASERVDADFSARVMSAVRAEAAATPVIAESSDDASRGWWRRPQTVHLTPLAGLALAAGIATIALLGSAGFVSLRDGSATGAGARATTATLAPVADTVHVVRFVLVDPRATEVALVGDFNDWRKDAAPLVESGSDGVWSVSVTLPPGRHEYAFLVGRPNGERWTADPFASRVRDDFGTESSVVTVGGARAALVPSST